MEALTFQCYAGVKFICGEASSHGLWVQTWLGWLHSSLIIGVKGSSSYVEGGHLSWDWNTLLLLIRWFLIQGGHYHDMGCHKVGH